MLAIGQELTCPDRKPDYLAIMPTALAIKPKRARSRPTGSVSRLANSEINSRLEQIELATVSSLRALQMDIEGDEGVPSSEVLKKARLALR